MTDERLAELRALAAAATPGPWRRGVWRGQCHVEDHVPMYHGTTSPCVYDFTFDADVSNQIALPKGNHFLFGERGLNEQDAAFIAASRTAIPELLDEIERLERRARCYGCQEGDHPCKDGSWRDCYVELPCGCSECTLAALGGTGVKS